MRIGRMPPDFLTVKAPGEVAPGLRFGRSHVGQYQLPRERLYDSRLRT